MKNIMIKMACALLAVGLSVAANAQFIEAKDQVRQLTHQTQLRNSDVDQWKYLVDLKDTFEKVISTVQFDQSMVKKIKEYCASDTDSYTCQNSSLLTSADSRMDSGIRDWNNVVLLIIEIEKSRSGESSELRFKQMGNFNALLSDMDRLNERAKAEYKTASLELLEFQELNPLLFTNES